MLQVANLVVDLGTKLSGVLETMDALCIAYLSASSHLH